MAILETIHGNPETTTSSLAASLGLSRTAIEKSIARLRAKGLLVRVGPARGGHWKVILS